MLPEPYVIPHLRLRQQPALLETLRTDEGIFSALRNGNSVLSVTKEWVHCPPSDTIPRYARFQSPSEATAALVDVMLAEGLNLKKVTVLTTKHERTST